MKASLQGLNKEVLNASVVCGHIDLAGGVDLILAIIIHFVCVY